MKITGRVGNFIITETHTILYNKITMKKNDVISCGIVGDPRVLGGIWKGWHFDKDAAKYFNARNDIFNGEFFGAFGNNQLYLDWSKLERL